jgi:hypothetical protein
MTKPTYQLAFPQRRISLQADLLRARALRGDPLADVSDSTREWIWRSLFKGIRLGRACQLANLSLDQVEPPLEEIRRRYQERCRAYLAWARVLTP